MESLKELIDYWTNKAEYIAEEQVNLQTIYAEHGDSFTTDQKNTHSNLVKRNDERYKKIVQTIKILTEVWNEFTRKINEHTN